MKILDRIGEFFVRFVYNTFWMRFINHYQDILLNKKLGSRGHRVYFSSPKSCLCPQKIFLFDDTNILPGATFIINPKCKNGRFIMKKNQDQLRILQLLLVTINVK